MMNLKTYRGWKGTNKDITREKRRMNVEYVQERMIDMTIVWQNKAEDVTIKYNDLPIRFRTFAARYGNDSLVLLGKVLEKGNYRSYVEEANCSGRICRILNQRGIHSTLVIRDDGTLWEINLKLFETWQNVKIDTTEIFENWEV